MEKRLEDKLWFAEDDNVYGYAEYFENEADFIKQAKALHIEQTDLECEIYDVKRKTFSSLEDFEVVVLDLYYGEYEYIDEN